MGWVGKENENEVKGEFLGGGKVPGHNHDGVERNNLLICSDSSFSAPIDDKNAHA